MARGAATWRRIAFSLGSLHHSSSDTETHGHGDAFLQPRYIETIMLLVVNFFSVILDD